MTEAQRKKLVELGLAKPEGYEPGMVTRTIVGKDDVGAPILADPSNERGRLQVLKSQAILDALPTTAGAGTAALLARLLSNANPYTRVIGPIVGAIGAGIGAKKAQPYIADTLLGKGTGERMEQTEALNYQTHPGMAILGSAAAAIPHFGVDPTVIRNAGRGIGQLLTGNARGIGREGLGAMGDVGIGAGLEMGFEGLRQYNEGEFSPGNLALAWAVGAPFTRFRAPLRKLAGVPAPHEVPKNFPEQARAYRKTPEAARLPLEGAGRARVESLGPQTVFQGRGESSFSPALGNRFENLPTISTMYGEPSLPSRGISRKAAEAQAKAERQAVKSAKTLQANQQRSVERLATKARKAEAEAARAAQELSQKVVGNAIENRKAGIPPAEELVVRAPTAPKNVEVSPGVIKSVEFPLLGSKLEPLSGPPPDSIMVGRKPTSAPEQQLRLPEERQGAYGLRKPPRYSEINIAEPTEASGLRLAPERSVPAKDLAPQSRSEVTQNWTSLMKSLGEVRNVTLDDSGRVFHAGTGREVKGESLVRQGVQSAMSKVNPEVASKDIWPHELTHPFIEDLATGPSKSGRKLINDGYETVRNSQEYKTWLEGRRPDMDNSPNEYLTDLAGRKFVDRIETKELRNWLKDFWSFAKTKFGKGTPADYQRLLGNRLMYDKPFAETYPGLKPSVKPVGSEPQYSEQEPSSPEFADMYGAANKPPPVVPKAKQTELPLEGTAAELARAKRAAEDPVSANLEKMRRRIRDEQLGQAILDDIEADGGSPKAVVEKFWKETFPRLSKEQQDKFTNMIRRITGLKPGDVIAVGRDGSTDIAKDWADVYPANEAGLDVAGLEGGERGLIALMETGNRIADSLPQSKQVKYSEVEDSISQVSAMDADTFGTHARAIKGGFTHEALALGQRISTKQELKQVKDAYETATQQASKAEAEGRLEDYINLASKTQYFSEAYGAATSTGASSGQDRGGKFLGEPPIDGGRKYSEILGEDNSTGRRAEANLTPEESFKRSPEEVSKQLASANAKDYERPSLFPILTSRFDKIAEVYRGTDSEPTARYVTQKLHTFHGEKEILIGRFANKQINTLKDYTPVETERMRRYAYEIDQGLEPTIELTAHESLGVKSFQQTLREVQRMSVDLGMEVQGADKRYRKAREKKEGYFPNTLAQDVPYHWARSTEVGKRNQKIFEDFVTKKLEARYEGDAAKAKAEAKQIVSDYMQAVNKPSQDEATFQALHRVEGMGLPYELTDPNLVSALYRYGNRAAHDIAFFKHIQNQPIMRKALTLRDQYEGRFGVEDLPEVKTLTGPAVNEALRSVYGHRDITSPYASAIFRAVNTTLMGYGTAGRNVLTLPTLLAAQANREGPKHFLRSLMELKKTRQRASEAGAIRKSYASFESAGHQQGDPDKFLRLANWYSDKVRRYTLRDISDDLEGHLAFMTGVHMADSHITMAKQGNVKSQKWLKDHGDLVDGGVEKLWKTKDAKVTDDDIDRLAKRVLDLSRGTYGPEGLPSGALEGGMAPVWSLARFSIERSNNFQKTVLNPMMRGDFKPMLRTLLVALGFSGPTIALFNEIISNRRSKNPTFKEIAAINFPTNTVDSIKQGDFNPLLKGLDASKWDIARRGLDFITEAAVLGLPMDLANPIIQSTDHGQTVNGTRVNIPGLQVLNETIAVNVAQALNAMGDAEDGWEILGIGLKLVANIATEASQAARYIDANFINPDDAKEKDYFRDMRVFNRLTRVTPDSGGGGGYGAPNKFKKGIVEEWKTTEDPDRIEELFPQIVRLAQERAKEAKPGYWAERLDRELTSMRPGNYNIIPSPNYSEELTQKFLAFIKDTQGEEAAKERVDAWLKRYDVNKAKTEELDKLY